MSDQLLIADMPIATAPKASSVVISPWVNEPHPPLHALLSSHDVARLTRRPSWLLISLSLIGRFPKKAKFRGRAFGWRQSEVFEWMARDLNGAERMAVPRVCVRRRPQQACLPLHGVAPHTPQPADSGRRRLKPQLPVGVRP
jgi:predicted DNA-binding transcriptional regulator AlpA